MNPENKPSATGADTPDLMLYFDHAAAVPVSTAVFERLRILGTRFFANQEASGAHARAVSQALKEAERRVLALFFPDSSDEWGVFPAFSGTGAVRAGIRSAASCFPRGGAVLFSDAEHASVLSAVESLPVCFRKVRIPLLRTGEPDPAAFSSEVSKGDTVLACISAVQSETGAAPDLSVYRKILRESSPSAFFFCDSIQAVGKLPFPMSGAVPDLFTVSGQKLGVPAGSFLILKKKLLPFASALRSSHQADRVPPAFILLLTERLEELLADLPARRERMARMKGELLSRLNLAIPDAFSVTMDPDKASPYILHLLLKNGVQGAIIVRALAAMGISVSSGSACEAEQGGPSRVLSAMGIGRTQAYGGLRLSFFDPVPDDELDSLISALKKALSDY